MAAIDTAVEILRNCHYPVFLTGAGISSESGIPTFRGADGLWKNFRAEDLATPAAFARSPELVWEWYNWRRSLILEKSPNKGHFAIVEIQHMFPDLPVITQNVDDLHRKSGAANLIEMHGNIFRARCVSCGRISSYRDTSCNRPVCESCGGFLRPDIVWFGESLDRLVMDAIYRHLQKTDLLVVVGTSGQVNPAAGFASQVHSNGAKVIEVNPEPVISFAVQLSGKSGEVLPELASHLAAA